MATRIRTSLLLTFASAMIACRSDTALVSPPPAPHQRLLSFVEVTPSLLVMEPGETRQLSVVALDQDKGTMKPASVSWVTSDSTVAVVSNTGIVTGVRAGKTAVAAVVIVGNVTVHNYMTAFVPGHGAPGEPILITFGPKGWQPAASNITAGTVVYWDWGSSWPGWPVSKVYLSDHSADQMYSSISDSVSFSDGLASRRFDRVGDFSFCAGGCWDPPDSGVIHVR